MPIGPIVVGLIAFVGIVLFFVGIAGSQSVDPVRARLTQLGTMQAKNLEEYELQQPFFERTVRPLALRLSGAVQRITSPRQTSRTEMRLAMAGNPADMRTADFLGLPMGVAILFAGGFFMFLGFMAIRRIVDIEV